jgi:peroxiredoxin
MLQVHTGLSTHAHKDAYRKQHVYTIKCVIVSSVFYFNVWKSRFASSNSPSVSLIGLNADYEANVRTEIDFG